jgi:segregation and condensation protein A
MVMVMADTQTNPWDASELAIKLKVFEGPLDLLIFLIRKNEIDVYDIPMETVTRQYIDYLKKMEQLNLEVAGDFFVMAATLMYIKSRMLLPPREQVIAEDESEESQDPRWELVQQLLEYRRYKELAGAIDLKIESRNQLVDRQIKSETTPEAVRPLEPIDRIDLWRIINLIYQRLAEKLEFQEITDEPITVAERMSHILARLQEGRPFFFSSLFERSASLLMVATTFLALLELTRLRRLNLSQVTSFGDIECIPMLPESKNT